MHYASTVEQHYIAPAANVFPPVKYRSKYPIEDHIIISMLAKRQLQYQLYEA